MGRVVTVFIALAVCIPPDSGLTVSGALAEQPVSAAPSATTDPPDTMELALATSAARECGRSSLYMLLRVQGHPVSYSEVEQTVEVGPHGSSILQLRDAAARLNVPMSISKRSLPELFGCPKPVLVYLANAASVSLLRDTGHFIVVLSADEKGIYALDGTTGRLDKYAVEKFPRFWSGHVLAPVPPFPWDPWAVVAAVGLWVCLGLWWWRGRTKRTDETLCRDSGLPARVGAGAGLPLQISD